MQPRTGPEVSPRPGYPGLRDLLLVLRYNPGSCRRNQECQRVRPRRGQDKETVHFVLCLHDGCPALPEGWPATRSIPAEIDVSGYNLLIIGTPVWAGMPAPAINAAVRALKGCEGKMAVIFTTCSNYPGEALPILSKALSDRGVRVMAELSLNAEDTKNPDAGGELLRQIIGADPLRGLDEGGTGLE